MSLRRGRAPENNEVKFLSHEIRAIFQKETQTSKRLGTDYENWKWKFGVHNQTIHDTNIRYIHKYINMYARIYAVERKQHISAVNQSLSLSSYDFFLSPKVSNKKNSDHGRVH